MFDSMDFVSDKVIFLRKIIHNLLLDIKFYVMLKMVGSLLWG
jgi:hypothetical protein